MMFLSDTMGLSNAKIMFRADKSGLTFNLILLAVRRFQNYVLDN